MHHERATEQEGAKAEQKVKGRGAEWEGQEMSTQKGEETDMCQGKEEQHVERSRQRFGAWGRTP